MSFIRFAASSFLAATLATSAFAADKAAAPLTREDVAAIVKDTLMNDPEIIMNALEKLRADKAEKAKKDSIAAIEKNKAEIFNDPDTASVGPKDADVTIVEFFDYHCGYCKHFLPELTKYMEEDKKLRVVFKEMPILSEDSVVAARAAIAVNRIDKSKFFDFHSALMSEKGKFDDASIAAVAKKVGIDAKKLKAEMDKPEVTATLDKSRKLAEELGIRGTPAVIIGNQLVPGAIPYEELKKFVADVRAGKPIDLGKAAQ